MVNSDCVLIMGSNMAESHPVAFHWPVEAQRRGATIVHVDPRYTRTSSVADVHVALRPGTDMAFLMGMIRYVLAGDRHFAEYVLHYTNAATIISPDYGFDEDAGLFAGFDPSTQRYDLLPHSWDYVMEPASDDSPGRPATDPTLEHPHCVFQILKRQVERYTPEVVADTCGCRPADIVKVAELLCRNSGRERTSNLAFALGFTQHASGPQTIRAAAILQLLLGNIGRPGGGITALRGHTNVQGATDIPLLFDTLPNYLPMPHATPAQATLADYVANGRSSGARRGDVEDGLWRIETTHGSWASLPAYMVSLLKAWYGDAANSENEFGYQWLPKIDGDWSELATFEKMRRGEVEGLILLGDNAAVSGPNSRLQRDAMRKLDWMVVLDLFETESASVWYADPEGPPPAEVGTEVFLLPVAMTTEKVGTITNTERLVQWHEKVIEPPGSCRSDLWWLYQLGRRLKELYADSTLERDAPIQHLTWDYAPTTTVTDPPGDVEPDAELVLRELNGFDVRTGEHLTAAGQLASDGSTACGSRLYVGVFPSPDDNRAKRLDGRVNEAALSADWGWAWPANTRVLYNRASADPSGKPWSERKKLVWWDDAEERWAGLDVPQVTGRPPSYNPDVDAKGMDAIPGDGPFTAHFDGKGWLFVPFGLSDGPLPTYSEPIESPYKNRINRQQTDPLTRLLKDTENVLAQPGDPQFPLVATTYHLTEHFMSTRNDSWLAELQPEVFAEIGTPLAAERGISNGEWIVVSSPRSEIELRVLVTDRMKPLTVHGAPAHVVGIVSQFGYSGEAVGASANDLTSIFLSANAEIHGAKSFVCDIRRGRLEGRKLPVPLPEATEPLVSDPVPETGWSAQPFGRQTRPWWKRAK
jgi:formate dehydrogenase major subunit